MSHQLRPGIRRAGPIFGVLLVMAGAAAALTPAVPGVFAVDPTPSPEPSPTVAPEPSAPPIPEPLPDPTATPPAPAESTAPTPPPEPEPSAASVGLRTTHAWIDSLDAAGQVTAVGEVDTTLAGMEPGATYRVWFQVVNGTDIGIDIGPVLESAEETPSGLGAFSSVPAPDAAPGLPFHVTADDGVLVLARSTPVPVTDLRLQAALDPNAEPVAGMVSIGLNPAGRLPLPAHSYTELGFTITVTHDAAWSSAHALRITDGGVELSSTAAALAQLRAVPAGLSDGQQPGATVGDPVPLYQLEFPELLPGQPGPPYLSPHLDLGLTGDSCAACHSTHTAQRAYLGSGPAPVANVCLVCHDGSGALSDVAAEYADPNVPANDPATGTWYSHPALDTTAHASDREDEFSGRLNRHAECADCHQPHLSDAALGVQTTSGWTASGAIRGASGVAVTNGAAGTAPTYAWQRTSTLEYQLCFKCHSGFTELTAGARDKGIELNPANGSYHPVEAAGTNQTPLMAANLAGSSPFKLWNFAADGTVRCTNCHGNPRTREPGTPAADARQAPHTSQYEGILIANYRRTLKPVDQDYDPADFALCYLCHAEAGILGDNDFTNFGRHDTHVVDMAGDGNAVCSECHAQTHSSALRPSTQVGDTSRLVVFGPSVTPFNGVIRWTSEGEGRGSCTLTCHGVQHGNRHY